MLNKLEVGKPYQEGVTRYQEGIKFDFTNSGAYLYIMFNSPTKKEIENIRNGNVEFAVYPADEVLFMLFKFGSLQWMDAPYSVHLSKDLVLQDIEEGQGYALHITLINADNGIVEVLRLIGLSTKFSQQLKKLIEKQKDMPFDINSYNLKINYIYRNYSADDIAKRTIIGYRHKKED